LTVSKTGLAIHTARDGTQRVFTFSASDLAELEDALAAADFPSLDPEYPPAFPVSDAFTYTLTHLGKVR
jgi:hypothetical protein